ncbi:hypothetical protein HYS94_01515 [Candidatus Daviesbacteria bacterium]|nr:hypothetical protein [Candidatus Daviesbacteria bacterium]
MTNLEEKLQQAVKDSEELQRQLSQVMQTQNTLTVLLAKKQGAIELLQSMIKEEKLNKSDE